jgi:hypothetical protein
MASQKWLHKSCKILYHGDISNETKAEILYACDVSSCDEICDAYKNEIWHMSYISGLYYKNILTIVSGDCKLCLYYKCFISPNLGLS